MHTWKFNQTATPRSGLTKPTINMQKLLAHSKLKLQSLIFSSLGLSKPAPGTIPQHTDPKKKIIKNWKHILSMFKCLRVLKCENWCKQSNLHKYILSTLPVTFPRFTFISISLLFSYLSISWKAAKLADYMLLILCFLGLRQQ